MDKAPTAQVTAPEAGPKRNKARIIGIPIKSNLSSGIKGNGILRFASLNVQSRIATIAPSKAVPAISTLFLLTWNRFAPHPL